MDSDKQCESNVKQTDTACRYNNPLPALFFCSVDFKRFSLIWKLISIYPTNISLSTAPSFGLIKALLHITALLAVDLGVGLPIRIQEKVRQVALSPGPAKIPSPPFPCHGGLGGPGGSPRTPFQSGGGPRDLAH